MAFWNENLDDPDNRTRAYIRRAFGSNPVLTGKSWQEDVKVTNIEFISANTLAVDLSDGTTIRVDFERYTR